MIIINRKYSPESFVKYVERIVVKRGINKIVYHHTSSYLEKWNGSDSILHYYNIYQSRGWASGPHIFIAPDGIWLFTDIRKRGTHAGKNGNAGSIGVEVVGRYYDELPQNEVILKNLALVNYILMRKFNLKESDLKNHKLDYNPECFCTPLFVAPWIMKNTTDHKDYIDSILRK